MATTTISYGTRVEFGSDANLNSLASAAACAIGVVDSTATTPTSPDGYFVDFAIVLASSAVSATGTLTFYLIQSASSSSSGFTDGISPTGSSVAASLKNADPIYIATANANSQTVADTFRLPVPDPAKYWSLVIQNGSGATLAASGHSVSYTPFAFVTS